MNKARRVFAFPGISEAPADVDESSAALAAPGEEVCWGRGEGRVELLLLGYVLEDEAGDEMILAGASNLLHLHHLRMVEQDPGVSGHRVVISFF